MRCVVGGRGWAWLLPFGRDGCMSRCMGALTAAVLVCLCVHARDVTTRTACLRPALVPWPGFEHSPTSLSDGLGSGCAAFHHTIRRTRIDLAAHTTVRTSIPLPPAIARTGSRTKRRQRRASPSSGARVPPPLARRHRSSARAAAQPAPPHGPRSPPTAQIDRGGGRRLAWSPVTRSSDGGDGSLPASLQQGGLLWQRGDRLLGLCLSVDRPAADPRSIGRRGPSSRMSRFGATGDA